MVEVKREIRRWRHIWYSFSPIGAKILEEGEEFKRLINKNQKPRSFCITFLLGI